MCLCVGMLGVCALVCVHVCMRSVLLCLSPLSLPHVCVTGVSPHLCAAAVAAAVAAVAVTVCVCVCAGGLGQAYLRCVGVCTACVCARCVCVSWWWCVRRGKGARTGGLLAIAVPLSAPPFPFFFLPRPVSTPVVPPSKNGRHRSRTRVRASVHVRTHGVCVCVCVHQCTPPPKS
jgi:hypothetical protein